MQAFSKITSKGQITIPKAVRESLCLKTGDKLAFVEIDGEIVVRVKNKRAVDLVGILGPPPSGETLTIEQIDEAIGQAVAEDDERIRREWHEDNS